MGDHHVPDRRGALAGRPATRRRPPGGKGPPAALATALLCAALTAAGPPAQAGGLERPASGHGASGHGHGRGEGPDVLPGLRRDVVAAYDFERPVRGQAARERDLGRSGTAIDLVNGGAAMRVRDGAHRGSVASLQTRQVDPAAAGNDDWKAGVYSATGVPTLRAFGGVREVTIMGWFKMTGTNPSPDTNTAAPDDTYNAVGLAGILSGDSDGHAVRALLELITVDGTLRLVALGRRVDGASSQTFAASTDWEALLPRGRWVFLAATFDYDDGTMALYRNGRPLDGFYTLTGDPWAVTGPPEPDRTSAAAPAGIKIGGSFPQDTLERNPCDCRMDSLMFLDRALTAREVHRQYRWATGKHHR